jgi:glutathione S-transferase
MFYLYDSLLSGNCYKVRLLLVQLDIPFKKIEIDIFKGETKTPEFLTKNPNGHVPALETESGEILVESNAILVYLADDTDFFPQDKLKRAQILQWLFFEQNCLEPNLGPARFWNFLLKRADEYKDSIVQKHHHGYTALTTMEQHLKNRQFFVGNSYTIADIGLFGYTHVSHEGGFEMSKFPAVQAWLERVKGQPKHISITQS